MKRKQRIQAVFVEPFGKETVCLMKHFSFISQVAHFSPFLFTFLNRSLLNMLVLELVKNLTVTLVTGGLLIINPLTIIAILCSRKIRNDSITPVLVSIFMTDFLQGIFLGIISTYLSWMNIIKPALWIIRFHSFYLFATTANIMSVTVLAVLQTIAVLKPLRFPVLVTKPKIWILVMITWITGIILGTLQATSSSIKYFPLTRSTSSDGTSEMITQVILLIMIAILAICHMIIFTIVIKQQIKIRVNIGSEGDRSGPNAILAAFKSAKRILAVTLTYLLLYVTGIVAHYAVPNETANFFIFWLAYSQSIWNSIFYLACSKEAWCQLKAIMCCQRITPEE